MRTTALAAPILLAGAVAILSAAQPPPSPLPPSSPARPPTAALQPAPTSATPAAAGAPAGATEDEWLTLAAKFSAIKVDSKASHDATMSFTVPTEVREILVVGGQHVHKGDILVRGRDTEFIASLEQQRLQAKTDYEVKNAEKALELAQLKYTGLTKGGVGSEYEIEEARIQRDVSQIQLDMAKMRLEIEKIKLKQAEGLVERYRLEAQFDGTVDKVSVELGQTVSDRDAAVRVVNTERLWLDALTPVSDTIRLKLAQGQRAWVLLNLAGRPTLVEGTILYVSPVAESVSQTRMVRVELVNKEGWPAGTQSRVRFTEPGPEWNEHRLAGPGQALGGRPSP